MSTSLADYLLLGVWLALVTGLGELAVLALEKFWFQRFIWLGPDVIWMAPLADVGGFVGLGGGMWLLGRAWPRLRTLRYYTTVLAFLGWLSLLLMYPRLHRYTMVLLAAGLAFQTGRYLAAHPHGVQCLVRRTLGWMVGLVVVLGVGWHVSQGILERRVLAQLSPPLPAAPNVLLIVLDTVRAPSLSLYGYANPTTPQMERLAQRGVVFEQAIATAPWTLPSHASMFTGRFGHELSVDWLRPLDATYPTLAEFLRRQGYVTAGFVANVEYCSYEVGLQRGFVHYEDYAISPGQLVTSSSLGRYIVGKPSLRRLTGYYDILGRKTAPQINQAFLDWLARQEQRPFFAFLNYYDAHEPYLPPVPFDTQFGNTKRDAFRISLAIFSGARKQDLRPADLQAEVNAYDGAIAYLDQHIGQLLDVLDQRGILKHTLVIITSDHGEDFGEHDFLRHVNGLYLPSLHVPLLLLLPSHLPAGQRVQAPVTLRDLPATVVDLLGLGASAPFPGQSLARHWHSAPGTASATEMLLSEITYRPRSPAWLPVAKGTMQSLVAHRYHYIKNGDGREELYDWHQDHWEQHDLALSATSVAALEHFRKALAGFLARR